MTAQQTTRLSDLCDLIVEPVDPTKHPDALYVGLEHLATGRFFRIGAGKAADVRSLKSSFRPGDVLYGKLRPYLDKAAIVPDDGICTTELLVLRAKEGVDPRFLVGILHSPAFVKHAISGTTGVQHPRTSWSHIRDFEMPRFSPDEQKVAAGLLWLMQKGIAASESKRNALYDLFTALLRGLMTREIRPRDLDSSAEAQVPAGIESEVPLLSVRPKLAVDTDQHTHQRVTS